MRVTANRRILHHQIQEKGSTFEVTEYELEPLLERQLVTPVPDETAASNSSSGDDSNSEAVQAAESSESDDLTTGSENQAALVLETDTKSFIKVDPKRLNRQLKKLAKRKEEVFTEENNLFDREKQLERLNSVLARKEEVVQAQMKEVEKKESELNPTSSLSGTPTNPLLVRPPMR